MRGEFAAAADECNEEVAVCRGLGREADSVRQGRECVAPALRRGDGANAHAGLDAQLVADGSARVDDRRWDHRVPGRPRDRPWDGGLQTRPRGVHRVGQELLEPRDLLGIAIDEDDGHVASALGAAQPHRHFATVRWQAGEIDQVGVGDRAAQHARQPWSVDVVEVDVMTEGREPQPPLAPFRSIPVNESVPRAMRRASVQRPPKWRPPAAATGYFRVA